MAQRHVHVQAAAVEIGELLARVGHDRELLRELVEITREDLPRLTEALRAATIAGDMSEVAAIAHTLKGMLSNLAGNRAAASASQIEQLAKNKAVDEVTERMATFEAELGTIVPELESHLAETERCES